MFLRWCVGSIEEASFISEDGTGAFRGRLGEGTHPTVLTNHLKYSKKAFCAYKYGKNVRALLPNFVKMPPQIRTQHLDKIRQRKYNGTQVDDHC